MPEVSVIIPTYNYGRFLGEAIQSVLDQTFANFELIVVDDGSTDNTREVVDSFKDPRIRYIYQENRGVAAAQNTGIKASSGEYIAILGSDDTWLPRNLELKVKLLDSQPDVALVCSDAYVFDNRTGATIGRYWHDRPFHYWVNPLWAAQKPPKEVIPLACFIMPQATVMRRTVFAEVGYFDESLPTHEDWDILVRIARRFPFETIDEPLLRVRRHDVSLTANQEKWYSGEVAFLNKAIRSYSLPKAELKSLKERLAQTHFSYGRQMILDGKITSGIKKLLAAVRVKPCRIRRYIYLALSILGSRGILNFESGKKWLRQPSARCQPSGDTQSTTGAVKAECSYDMEKEKEGHNSTPKVSVIIPTHNYSRFLGEAIQSVLDQTFTDFELVVVDDGSTDNTREVVESFKDPRIRYVYQEHRGVSAAQNTGVKATSGEYICGLGADDIYLPQNIEIKVEMLDANPDVALVCSDAYILNIRTGANLGRYWHDKPFHYWVDAQRASQQPLKELLSRGCFIAPQTGMARRQMHNEVGFFDESLATHEDWDLFIRFARRFPIKAIDVPLLKIRQHDVSLTSSWDRMYLGAVAVLKKAISSYSFSKAELKLVEERLARTHFSYGKAMVLNGRIDLGREKLIAAIRVNPWCIKPYVYLAGSFLGNGAILTLKSWRKRLEWRIVR